MPPATHLSRAQLDVLTRGNSEAQVAAEAKLVELKSSFEVRECVRERVRVMAVWVVMR
jgi:hypothetical protein